MLVAQVALCHLFEIKKSVITDCIADRGGQSHGYRLHVQKIW